MELLQGTRGVRLASALGEGTLGLRSLRATEGLSELFDIEIDAESAVAASDIDLDDLLGTNVTVAVDCDRSEPRWFSGIVVEAELLEDGESALRMRLAPWLWFLTLTQGCSIYLEMSLREILSDVFDRNGFTDYEFKSSRDGDKIDYCVQYNETDFNFVSRLMENAGLYYHFEHENGLHKLIIVDAMAQHEAAPGYETFVYEPASNEAGLSHEAIRRWQPVKRVRPARARLRSFDFLQPAADLGAESEIRRKHAMAEASVYEYPGRYVEKTVGEKIAETRIEEFQASHHMVEAESTLRGVASGRTFRLAGHPITAHAGEYLVVSAVHRVTAAAYESGGGGGETYDCRFRAMPTSEAFRAPRRAPKPRIAGLQTARVVGEAGDEIATDEHARVRVAFHWLPGTRSCPVRVSQPWVGDGFGAVSIPRVGDEVVVAFEGGDPDRPLITGSLYNGRAKPPYALPDKSTVTAFKTNSVAGSGFNEFAFDDKSGSENVFLHAQMDYDFRALNDVREWIGAERHAEIGKSAFANVGEDLHETVGQNVSRSVGSDEQISVGANRMVTVGASQDVNVGQDASLTAGMKMNLNAGMDLLATGGMNVVINAGMTAHVKAGMAAVIEAPMGVTLACGGNFVAVTPAGVAIQGTMVTINTGGAKGSGPGTKAAKAKKAKKPTKPKEARSGEPGAKPAAAPSATFAVKKFQIDSNPVSATMARARDAAAPFADLS